MAEGGTFTFTDSDRYAAGFGDARVSLTITGAGDFKARLTWLKLKQLEVNRCCLPRIAFISFPPERIFLSFPVGRPPSASDGFAFRNGDMVLHSRGEHAYQRSEGECQWGLISLSPEQLASYGKALTGQPIVSSPPRAEYSALRARKR